MNQSVNHDDSHLLIVRHVHLLLNSKFVVMITLLCLKQSDIPEVEALIHFLKDEVSSRVTDHGIPHEQFLKEPHSFLLLQALRYSKMAPSSAQVDVQDKVLPPVHGTCLTQCGNCQFA